MKFKSPQFIISPFDYKTQTSIIYVYAKAICSTLSDIAHNEILLAKRVNFEPGPRTTGQKVQFTTTVSTTTHSEKHSQEEEKEGEAAPVYKEEPDSFRGLHFILLVGFIALVVVIVVLGVVTIVLMIYKMCKTQER